LDIMKKHRTTIVLSALIALAGCSKEVEVDPRTQAPLVAVTILKVPSDVRQSFTGVVRARVESDLGFRVPGKIVERLVDAGQTVKLIGAVFGKAAVANVSLVGTGLRLLDNNMSYEELGTLAINETGKKTNIDIVSLLWTNLFGSAPTSGQSAPYVAMLDKGILSSGALAVMAADTGENMDNIDLVGLTQTGVAYI
jgi:hypothetical protein